MQKTFGTLECFKVFERFCGSVELKHSAKYFLDSLGGFAFGFGLARLCFIIVFGFLGNICGFWLF